MFHCASNECFSSFVEEFVKLPFEICSVRGRKPVGGQDRTREKNKDHKLGHRLSVSIDTTKGVERALDAVRRRRGEVAFFDTDTPARNRRNGATIKLVVSEWRVDVTG